MLDIHKGARMAAPKAPNWGTLARLVDDNGLAAVIEELSNIVDRQGSVAAIAMHPAKARRRFVQAGQLRLLANEVPAE